MIIKANNAVALARKKRIAPGVTLLMFSFKMLPAVDFDHQLRFVTKEIDDVGSDRCLTAKTRTIHSVRS